MGEFDPSAQPESKRFAKLILALPVRFKFHFVPAESEAMKI